MIKAKKIENNSIKFQSLQEHTNWVIEESLGLIDDYSLEKISKISNWKVEKIKDLIFFSAYFHDIGKATNEFQNTIQNGSKSYHPLYSASLLVEIENFNFKNQDNDRFINLLLIVVLTHHTLFSNGLYSDKSIYNFNFLSDTQDIFLGYKKSYQKYLQKGCDYDFKFNLANDF